MAQVVAFYKTSAEAERAKDQLLAAGFSRSDVRIFSKDSAGSTATAAHEDRGFWESVKEFFGAADEEDHELYGEAARRGSVGVAVDVDDATEQQKAAQVLKGNAVDLDQESTQWRQSGWTGRAASPATTAATGNMGSTGATASAARTAPATNATAREQLSDKEVVPVVEEQLKVGKQRVQGGAVRIHTRVTEKPVQAQVQLREEHVNVQRHAVDRPVTANDAAFRERVIEATESSERPVVSKEARVVEEVVVSKDVQQRTQTVGDTIRRTDVDVEKTNASASASNSSFSNPDAFATEMAGDTRFRGREWTAVESDARQTFEQRYPGTKWDQFKDAIHRGYEKVRQKV